MDSQYFLTDTHTHIYYKLGKPDFEDQIKRCLDNNITRLFLPNVNSASIDLVINSAKAYPKICFPMLGLHPCSVKEDYKQELECIEKAIALNRIYAIGEIGIDLYWDKSTLDLQIEAFSIQIQWAKKLGLPIIIHCREAFDEVFDVLEKHKDVALYGIFHCFTGSLEQAQRAIQLGFKLGIGGVVTFKKAGLDLVVKELDLKDIVLETDAPYLAPSPYRGKENESSYLYYIAKKVSSLHEISIEELAQITTQNSIEVFNT